MDIRKFYVEALIESAYMNECDPNLIINADATTFGVYGDGMVTKMMIVKDDNKGPATIQDPSFLGLYIKVYNFPRRWMRSYACTQGHRVSMMQI